MVSLIKNNIKAALTRKLFKFISYSNNHTSLLEVKKTNNQIEEVRVNIKLFFYYNVFVLMKQRVDRLKFFFMFRLQKEYKFKTIQANMILCRKILISNKLKVIVQSTNKIRTNLYFKRFKSFTLPILPMLNAHKRNKENQLNLYNHICIIIKRIIKSKQTNIFNTIKLEHEKSKIQTSLHTSFIAEKEILDKTNKQNNKQNNKQIRSIILKHICKNNITNNTINTMIFYKYFTKWNLQSKNINAQEVNLVIEKYEELITEFQNKMTKIEINFNKENQILLQKNEELDKEIKTKDEKIKILTNDFYKVKNAYEKQNESYIETTKFINISKQNINQNESQISDLIEQNNHLSQVNQELLNKLQKEEEYREELLNENDTFREKMDSYQKSISSVEKKKEDLNKLSKENKEYEKKYNNLNQNYQVLKKDLEDKNKKIEYLKHSSAETTEELIVINNELNKYKSELFEMSEINRKLRDDLSKFSNDENTKERTLKQLKLSNDTQKHQFSIELEKLENKYKVIYIITNTK